MPMVSAQALVLDAASPISGANEALVDPASRFRVEVQARLEDARLVLLDEQDAMVPVEGLTEVGATTRFTLAPSGPLIPGTSYTLRLEGGGRREASDAEGNRYLPVALRLRTTGEKPHAALVKKSRPAKRRRQ